MANVTIQDMMLCRENRANLQTSLLRQFPENPVLSFCMNIPGPVISERNWGIEKDYEIHEKTGDEWLASIRAKPSTLKDAMCDVEENHPLGRIYDIDIIAPDGQKLSRPNFRTCLLCGRQAQDCARSRRHSAAELFARTKQLIREGL